MNKTKIILAAVGGVSVLAALVLAWFVWEALSANSDKRDEIASEQEQVSKCLAGKVYPCKEGEQSVKTNAALLAAWGDAAFAHVSKYDRTIPEVTPPAFKAAMVERARKIAERPGSAEGHFAAPEFGFGSFNRYIIGKELPPHASLARLQREWDDVAFAAEVLADCGAEQLTEVGVTAAADPAKPAAGAKPAKDNKKGKGRKAAAESGPKSHPAPTVTRCLIGFLAHPAAFVRALDVFATTNRFVVVEDFAFVRAEDDLTANLTAGGEKQEEKKSAGRRSRRGRDTKKSKSDETALQEKRKGAVTDPETSAPLKVTLKLAFYDFGCPVEEKQNEPAAGAAVTNAVAVGVQAGVADTNKVEEVTK